MVCLRFHGFSSRTRKARRKEKPQNNTLNNIVNTLKERITLEGYMQLGYTYNDQSESKTNTFEMTRAILMARGRITDHWSCYFMYSLAGTPKFWKPTPNITFP